MGARNILANSQQDQMVKTGKEDEGIQVAVIKIITTASVYNPLSEPGSQPSVNSTTALEAVGVRDWGLEELRHRSVKYLAKITQRKHGVPG